MSEIIVTIMFITALVVLVLWQFDALPKRSAKPAKSTAPAECEHEWDLWSDPVEQKVSTRVSIFSDIRPMEYVGKYQDRKCLKCNEYARRWA